MNVENMKIASRELHKLQDAFNANEGKPFFKISGVTYIFDLEFFCEEELEADRITSAFSDEEAIEKQLEANECNSAACALGYLALSKTFGDKLTCDMPSGFKWEDTQAIICEDVFDISKHSGDELFMPRSYGLEDVGSITPRMVAERIDNMVKEYEATQRDQDSTGTSDQG